MSRVHKYRAYDKINNRMWYPNEIGESENDLGFFSQFNDKGELDFFLLGKDPYGEFNGYLKEFLPKMEFTGLLDKNGVEIYEGDIIKIESIVYYSDSSKKVYRNGKVIWNQNKSRFEVFLSKKHYNTFIWAVNEQSEVIGNIFENPEYLEE